MIGIMEDLETEDCPNVSIVPVVQTSSSFFESLFEYQSPFLLTHVKPHWIELSWVILSFLLIEIPGNISLMATIAFEKFGMDSKKRTIINQLLSHISGTVIWSNLIVFPILMSKWVCDFLPLSVVPWVLTLLGFASVILALSLCEIMVVKCLYIWKWSFMSSVDDDFWSVVLGLTNLIISGLGGMQRHILDDGTCYSGYQRMTGQAVTAKASSTCTWSKMM